MHRFLKYTSAGSARVALRSDASIWLTSGESDHISLNRGNGWVQARRLCLCHEDRVRVGETEYSPAELCGRLGVELNQAGNDAVSEHTFPTPVTAPASVIDNARRNPGTGQIESGSKEQS